jgi:TolA-binding protein
VSPCARAWQAEARRDGRLGALDRARFERHLAACAACRAATASLDGLGERLRALPGAEVDALAARRGRLRLLQSWDDALLRPRPRVAPGRAVAAALVVAAAALGGYAARRVTPAPATAQQGPRDPFAAALEALHAGHVTDAAERFERIAARDPRGPRAEDADYLAVVSWMRAGRPERVRDAAARYLTRHPEGFRRREVEVVARMVGGDR